MFRRSVVFGAMAAILSACTSKFRSYEGPKVTRIQVFKEKRVMQLLHNRTLLQQYHFELGFAPEGHKAFQGDGRTPEGGYLIDRKNPDSDFHLSLGISYPNRRDIAFARARGQSPGGDIFIHGTPKLFASQDNWTRGCIAVTNREMEVIYAMVEIGTPIYIYP